MGKRHPIFTKGILLWIGLLMMGHTLAAILSNVGVRSADQTVSSVTTLTLFSTIVTAIDAGGRFEIVVPATTSISSGILACTMIEPSSIGISCSGNAVTRKITVTLNNVMAGSTFFQVDINGFTNPDSTKTTDTFEFYTFNSAGTGLDNRASSTFLTATAGALSSISLTATDQTVAALNTVNFNFATTHKVTKGGTIRVAIPKWDPNAVSTTPQSMVQGSFICAALENLEGTISCAFDSTTDILTVSNAFTSADISAGTVLRFSLSGIRNPISTAPKTGFTISTISGDGGTVDSSAATLTVSNSAAIIFQKLESKVTKIVQEKATIGLTFTSPVPLEVGCILRFVFPPTLPLSSSYLESIRTVGLFGTARDFSSWTMDTSTRTITITDGCTSYLTNTAPALIEFKNIQNPLSTRPTDSITITLTDSAGFGIATISTGIQYVATFGQMVSGSLSANPTTIGSISAVSVSLFPTHKITTAGALKFTFPSDISFPSPTCTLSFRENIQAGATCSASGQIVRITNPFLTDYIPSSSTTSTIRFVINSVQMPATTAPTGTFSFESVLVDGSIDYVIDKSSYTNLVTATAGTITSATVTPSSTLANDLASYTITFTNANQIVQDGKIQVTLPSEIVFPTPSTTANSCTAISGVGTSLICEATTNTLTINSGFSSGALAAGNTISFRISNVRNPSSLKPSSSFTIKTLSDTDFDIDKIDTGVLVTMVTFNNIVLAEITPESLVNGATTNLDFKIVSPSPLQNGDLLYITFPTSVKTPSLPISCSGTTALSGIVCTRDSTGPDVIKIVLNFSGTTSVEASELLEFKISNCVNPTTTEPSGLFGFTITDSLNFKINSWSGTVRVTTTEGATLLTPSILPSSTVARADINLIFTFTLVHDIPSTGVIYIYYPSSVGYTAANLGCQCIDFSSGGSTSTCTCEKQTVSGRERIIFRNAFASGLTGGSTVRITLIGLSNPSTADTTNSFEIFTETSETGGYEIDKVTTGLTLKSDCDYPCLTCSTSSSTCTSCIVTLQAFKLEDTNCVLTCSDDKFYNSTSNVCEACAPQCGACSTIDKSLCTKCGLTGYEFLHLGTCSDTCPGRFFGNSTTNTCDSCNTASAHCLNCEGTSTNCISCDTSSAYKYLHNNLCISSCPANLYIQDDTLGKCVACDSNCGTCSGSTTHCTSCSGNNKLDLRTNTCVATCETGKTIVTGNTCVACDSSCNTCADTTTTCTSCTGGTVLTSDYTCASTCTNTNEIVVGNTCTSCTPTCTRCQDTITNCTQCATDYALHQNECISDCPQKYEDQNQVCVYVGLVCPTNYVSDETQESCIPLLKECKGGKVLNSSKTKCIPPGDIAPFPILCVVFCLIIVVISGKCKDKSRSKIVANLIPLLGLLEIPAIILLAFTALFIDELLIFGIAMIAAALAILLNIIMNRLFAKYTRPDEDFQFFAKRYPKTSEFLPFLSLVWSFRVLKFFYSGFFGQDTCMLTLSNAEGSFMKYFRRITYCYFFLVHLPVYFACALGIMSIEWGFQALVECIEVPIVLLTILFLCIFEKCYDKSYLKQDPYLPLNGMKKFKDDLAVMSAAPHYGASRDRLAEEESKTDNYTVSHEGDHNYMKDMEYDVELRKKALESIINHVKNPERRNSLFDDDRSISNCTFFEEEKYESSQRRKMHRPPRRAFSFKGLNPIDEEDEFLLSDESSESDYRDMRFEKPPPKIERRMSFPMRADELETVENPIFHEAIDEYRNTMKQDLQDNCYADSKPPKPVIIHEPPVMAEMGTQTVLRDLLFDEEDSDEDLDRAEAEDVEIESNFAGNLIGDVIDQLSESSALKEKKVLDADRLKEIPEFELEDILGEFDVDEEGNFILNSENGTAVDNNGKRVNSKGYFIDEEGNIINKKGELIFYAHEINDDGEIPAPFVYEKHKNDFLAKAMNKREGKDLEQDYLVDDDEDLVEEELKKLRPSSRESSVESLVADNPGMYIDDKVSRSKFSAQVSPETNLDAERVSKGRQSKISPKRKPITFHDVELAHSYGGKPKGNLAPKKIKGQPKRIKREDTRELFPSLAVENQAQSKLSKIMDNISKKDLDNSSDTTKIEKNKELMNRLQKLKDEHFRDLDSDELGELNMDLIEQKIDDFDYNRQKEYDEKMKRHIESGISTFTKPPLYTSSNFYNQNRMPFLNSDLLPNQSHSRKALSKLNNHSIMDGRNKTKPMSGLQKIYGNLGELVVPTEQRDFQQKSRMYSPGSTSTIKSPFSKRLNRSKYEPDSRIRGLEMIYMQKLEKQKKDKNSHKKKAKFRTLYNRYIDDQSIMDADF